MDRESEDGVSWPSLVLTFIQGNPKQCGPCELSLVPAQSAWSQTIQIDLTRTSVLPYLLKIKITQLGTAHELVIKYTECESIHKYVGILTIDWK